MITAGDAAVVGAASKDGSAVSKPEDGRPKWTECLDEANGTTYYFNVLTVYYSATIIITIDPSPL